MVLGILNKGFKPFEGLKPCKKALYAINLILIQFVCASIPLPQA